MVDQELPLDGPPTPEQAAQIDRACRRFEADCRAGLNPRLDDYLGETREPLRSELRRRLEAVAARLHTAGTVTVPVFIERLADSGLMTADECRAFIAALPADKRPQTGEDLAQELFHQKRLTKFQVQAVYQGKTRGLLIGNYVVLDVLGHGGMGDVYKAQHRQMNRVVALKVLPRDVTKSPEAVQRFKREVEAASRLSHPNIVTAFDADQYQGTHFFAMEFVDGSDLARLVRKKGPLPVAQAIEFLLQAAQGLDHAHRHGVVHRDIKPSNLLCDKTCRTVKILDLGLAKFETARANAPVAGDLTRTGQVMGSIDYMAPEQAMDTRQADARSDIYSLGCTLYYLLAGRPPYDADDTMARKIVAHRESPIPSLRAVRPDVPEPLDFLFRQMLAKRPDSRPQSMAQVAALLERCERPGAEPPVIRVPPGNPPSGGAAGRRPDRPGVGPGGSGAPADDSGDQIIALDPSSSPGANSAADTDKSAQPSLPLEQLLAEIPSFPSEAAKIAPVPGRWRQRRDQQKLKRLVWVMTVFAGMAAVLLIVLLWTSRTPKATLIVEVGVAGAMIEVLDGNEQVVYQRPAKEGATLQIPISAGPGRLRATKRGAEIFAQDFNLAPGGEQVIAVQLGAEPTPAPRGAAAVEGPPAPSVAAVGPKVVPQSAPPAPDSAVSRDGQPPANAADVTKADWEASKTPGSPAAGPPPAISPFDAAQARQHQAAWAEFLNVQVETVGPCGIRLMLIPPGQFLMGESPKATTAVIPSDEKRARQTYPLHSVRIGEPFYLGQTEVTVGQFRAFVEDTGYKTLVESNLVGGWGIEGKELTQSPKFSWKHVGFPQSDDHPVVNVSLRDANAFCEWLGKKEGRTYYLPTEIQWEFACRAGTTTAFFFGDDPEEFPQYGNIADVTTRVKKYRESGTIRGDDGCLFTARVGRFQANAFGLSDMHGNVSEFCMSGIERPIGSAGVGWGSQVLEIAGIRGGSWLTSPWEARCAERGGLYQSQCNAYIGFRVARAP